ncbi:hypothetical protein PXC01_05715 [Maribacter sp. M208]|uniref:hypothetical protein n=1 Tax=Maribacter huludaoensis TaxID=3030010 RepID=UPI0023EE1C47|nr:hypothetical protein [Maribacter huludaoensis]MDF4221076.1 hypothetical protein [Maribacter huludaoensis]
MKDSLGKRVKRNFGLETEFEKKKRVEENKKANQKGIEYFERIWSKPDVKKVHNITTNQFKTLLWKVGNEYFKNLNRSFDVDDKNKHFLDLIAKYFSGDPAFETETSGELRKGLMIFGPCGTGKSSVFDIIRKICIDYNLMQYWFSNVSVHDVVTEFNKHGESIVDKYSKGVVHFDDLGTEKMVQLWGVKENLFTRLLQIRYNNFKLKGTKTYVTTNHSIKDLEKIYGKQVYDRLYEMFNFIELGGVSRRY